MSGSCVTIRIVMPALAVEPGEQPHDLDRSCGVEVAGRLVGEEHRRLRHDRARDRDALLLAPDSSARRMMLPARRARPRRALRGRAVRARARRHAAIDQRQLHVLERGRARLAG